MLRLNRLETQAFLRVCNENINRLSEQVKPPEKVIDILNRIQQLVSFAQLNNSDKDSDIEIMLIDEAHALIDAFTEVTESGAYTYTYDEQLFSFLYQFNYTNWLNYNDLITFRRRFASHEILMMMSFPVEKILRDIEKFPDWFIKRVESKNSSYAKELFSLEEEKVCELIPTNICNGFKQALKLLNHENPDLLAAYNRLNLRQKIILSAYIFSLEDVYAERDTSKNRLPDENTCLAYKAATQPFHHIDTIRHTDVLNNIIAHLSRISEQCQSSCEQVHVEASHIHLVSTGNVNATVESVANNNNDYSNDNATNANELPDAKKPAELNLPYFLYYAYPGVSVSQHIDRDGYTLSRDFIFGGFKLNGQEKLGYSATQNFMLLKKDEIRTRVRQIIDKENKLDDETFNELSIRLNQGLLTFGINKLLVEKSEQFDNKMLITMSNSQDNIYSEITVDVKSNGEVYVTVICHHLRLPILYDPNKSMENIGHIEASLKVTFQLIKTVDNNYDIEMKECCSDNKHLIALIRGDKLDLNEFLPKCCSSASPAVKKNIFETYAAYHQDIELQQNGIEKHNQKSLNAYISELESYIRCDYHANKILNNSAQVVLGEIKNLRNRKWPKVNESELISVLEQTINLMKTPMLTLSDSRSMKPNPVYTQLQSTYLTKAGELQKSGTNKILAGAMVALVAVGVIVTCALLIASTLGAGAAVGIPLLVGAAFVPHFAAGMGVAAFFGGAIGGLFGVKAINRGIGDIKLSKAMTKLNNEANTYKEGRIKKAYN